MNRSILIVIAFVFAATSVAKSADDYEARAYTDTDGKKLNYRLPRQLVK